MSTGIWSFFWYLFQKRNHISLPHATIQECFLFPFKTHEILGFDILNQEAHCYHEEISEIPESCVV